MKKVLKGGTVVSGEGCKKADVLVEDGKIGAVAPEITDEEAEVVDVSGKLLFTLQRSTREKAYIRLWSTGMKRPMATRPVTTASTWPYPTGMPKSARNSSRSWTRE